ncbi:hypothetical protein D3C85_1265470 [compost metagenome]
MALVAITSVQLTTPRRTFWHSAGSAATALLLRIAVPVSISRQQLISLFMMAPPTAVLIVMGDGARASPLSTMTSNYAVKTTSNRTTATSSCTVATCLLLTGVIRAFCRVFGESSECLKTSTFCCCQAFLQLVSFRQSSRCAWLIAFAASCTVGMS